MTSRGRTLLPREAFSSVNEALGDGWKCSKSPKDLMRVVMGWWCQLFIAYSFDFPGVIRADSQAQPSMNLIGTLLASSILDLVQTRLPKRRPGKRLWALTLSTTAVLTEWLFDASVLWRRSNPAVEKVWAAASASSSLL